MNGKCCFCLEKVNIQNCMIKSLYNKYDDVPHKQLELIDSLFEFNLNKNGGFEDKQISQIRKKRLQYKELLHVNFQGQMIQNYCKQSQSTQQLKKALDYYKYRIYVPLFSQNTIVLKDIVQGFYYQKLKNYYNTVKKKLNMVVIDTQDEEEIDVLDSINNTSSQNQSENRNLKHENASRQNKLLKSIQFIKNQNQNNQYQTESKALEGLVKTMKKDQNFKNVKTFKTEDCLVNDQFKDFNNIFPINLSKQKKGVNNLQIELKDNNFSGSKWGIFIKNKIKKKSDQKFKSGNLIHFKQQRIQNSKRSLESTQRGNILKLGELIKKSDRQNLRQDKNIKIAESIKIEKYSSLRSLRTKGNKIILNKYKDIKNEEELLDKNFNKTYCKKDRIKSNQFIKYESMPKINIHFEVKKQCSSERKGGSVKKYIQTVKYEIKNSGFNIEQENIFTIRKKKLQILKIRNEKNKNK